MGSESRVRHVVSLCVEDKDKRSLPTVSVSFHSVSSYPHIKNPPLFIFSSIVIPQENGRIEASSINNSENKWDISLFTCKESLCT
ncbi:hypothetical protein J5N97_011281 [Dioscorea zingiberensis]|uniref:Uncharacterized protein n=1 Tax=Dioscorea zingiberensis TaxID=325984 RepID=A0A9D5HNK2_9LILI|nr:hypothetical protein J5N97_011281 [Dioscorea zingiberensis]